jgi:hypothetical protein
MYLKKAISVVLNIYYVSLQKNIRKIIPQHKNKIEQNKKTKEVPH